MTGERIVIAVGGDTREQWLPDFARAMPGATVMWRPDCTDEELAAADWAVVWAPEPDLIDRLGRVKALFSLGAGVDHLMGAPNLPQGVPIIRYVGRDLTNRMSEWVVLQCLTHLRLVATYRRLQAERLWQRPHQPGAEEVTIGVMGLGVLGRDAARKLQMMGFRVRGWARGTHRIADVETFAGSDEFSSFLAGTDILVSLLPLTPATRGLVTRDVLALLRRSGALGGPVYINAGRGGTQRDADIDRALRDGLLIGASLDVFETEPLPADSPLWTAPNLVMTPHAAAWSPRSDVVRYVAEQIGRHHAGLGFENVVDPQRGY